MPFSANSRKAVGISILGISNFGISNLGTLKGDSLAAAGFAFAFGAGVGVLSAMIIILGSEGGVAAANEPPPSIRRLAPLPGPPGRAAKDLRRQIRYHLIWCIAIK